MKNGNLRKFTAECFLFIIAILLSCFIAFSHKLELTPKIVDGFLVSLGVCIGGIILIIKEVLKTHIIPKVIKMAIKKLPNEKD